MSKRLTVAIDEIAMLRYALNDSDFDPVQFAVACEIAGAQGIGLTLLNEARGIQERDAQLIKRVRKTFLNIRLTLDTQAIKSALTVSPDMVTFIDIGGDSQIIPLSASVAQHSLEGVLPDLHASSISVAVFCRPEITELKALSRLNVDYVEFDVSEITRAADSNEELVGLDKLQSAVMAAAKLGLGVNCYGGIEYQHLSSLASIPRLEDIAMGPSLFKRSVYVGLDRAIEEAQRQILFYQRES